MNTPLTPTPQRPDLDDWRDEAICQGREDEFLSDHAALRAHAAVICRDCPVIAMCKREADRNSESFGVWAGEDRTPQPVKRRPGRPKGQRGRPATVTVKTAEYAVKRGVGLVAVAGELGVQSESIVSALHKSGRGDLVRALRALDTGNDETANRRRALLDAISS